MEVYAVRLMPGTDLKAGLDAHVRALGLTAAFVLSGIGSLDVAVLRLADGRAGTTHPGPLEILSLDGTLGPDGGHLHAAVADARGRVRGGHVMPGCVVRTTAEIVPGADPSLVFAREQDAATGYRELVVQTSRGGVD